MPESQNGQYIEISDKKKGKFKRIFILTISLCISVLPLYALIRFPNLVEQFDKDSYLGLFILNFLNASSTITAGFSVPIPGLLLTFLAARILNPWYVGFFSGLGAGIGEIFGYPVGIAGRIIVGERRFLVWLGAWVKKYGGWIIFIGAALPNPFFDFWGLAAGLAEYSFSKFVKLVIVARIIRALITSYLGFHYASNLLPWISN